MYSAAVGDLDGDGVDDLVGGDLDTLSAIRLDGEPFATFPNLDRVITPALAIGTGPRLILGSSGAVHDLAGPFSGAIEVAPNWASDDESFGEAVALAGNRLYVGARGWTDEWSEQGAIFWFE